MKHCRLALPFAARCWLPVAVSLVLACAPDSGDATLLVDSTLLRESSEVVAVPVDPLSLRTRPPFPTRPVSLTDTVAIAAVLRDSAERLDAVFQRERELLNAEARLLQALPPAGRRSADYARQYASFILRLEPAQRARFQRDSLRSRANRLLPAHTSAGMARVPHADDATARAALLAAADGRRRTIVAPAAPVVRLRLASGEWWIGLGATGQLPAHFRRVRLAGRADTVRLPAP